MTNKKKKALNLFLFPMFLSGCTAITPAKTIENSIQRQPMKKKVSTDFSLLSNTGSTSGSTSSNYQSNGYPSIYGYETHKSECYQSVGTEPTISNAYGYHDIGVKVYSGNTATNIGSTSNIRLNESSPYFDFTDATWMFPSALKAKQNTTTTTTGLMSFKVEAYKGSVRHFHAGAEVNLDSSGNIVSVTYDKYTSTITDTNCSKTLDDTTIDFSKLGKIASSLYSGSYTIKVTYSYLWVYGSTYTDIAIIKTTATMNIDLIIDYTKPTIEMKKKSSGTVISNGSYSNEAVTVTASDENLSNLYYKTPDMTSYSVCGNTYTTGSSSGWYSFYATDKCGNQSDEYKVYIDMEKPEGILYVNGKEVSSGSYVSDSFSY